MAGGTGFAACHFKDYTNLKKLIRYMSAHINTNTQIHTNTYIHKYTHAHTCALL